jgi:hypothetical protein
VFQTRAAGVSPEERMRISSAGFVGIGKTVPSGPLHVKGANGIYVEGAVNTNTGRMVMTGSANEILAVGLNGVYASGRVKLGAGAITPANGGWIDSFADGQHLFYGLSSAERFRIGAAGQWGIGGATYGTAGQAMLSGGASAAPAWGDVVTPTGTQTLTNKTITFADNQLSGVASIGKSIALSMIFGF